MVALMPLALGTQSFDVPNPVPAPEETWFYFYPNQWLDTVPNPDVWTDYYDIRYSVYGITESPYGNLQEGPYYPDEDGDSNLLADHYCEYTTQTYAAIYVKKTEFHYWNYIGSVYMNSGNVTMVQGSQIYVYKFHIDMDDIPSS